MALRAASTLRPEYHNHLLLRTAAMPELDRILREKSPVHGWRAGAVGSGAASRIPGEPSYNILWTELKEAGRADRGLEQELEQSVPASRNWSNPAKSGSPAEAAEKA